jgi:hypothetical protein
MHTLLIRPLCNLKVEINWKCQEGICSDVIRNMRSEV